MRSNDIQFKDERPVAYLLSIAYPELWTRFVARCEYEQGYKELDARLLEPTPVELECAA